MDGCEKNTANVSGLRENSAMTESEKLKSRATDLTILAIIWLFGATACAIAALWPHYMNSENPVRWIWLYISVFPLSAVQAEKDHVDVTLRWEDVHRSR